MGSRNRFTNRTKKKEEEKKKKYTTKAGRRSNRVAAQSSTIPASKRPADMRRGVTYGDAGRPYQGPGGNPNGSGQGQAQQAPPPPKLPPKPSSTPTSKPKTTKKPTPSKPTTSTKKPTPSSAAQNLRSGRTPDKAPTKPAKKVYGSKGRKDLKQSSRMAAALKDLKVRKYKN